MFRRVLISTNYVPPYRHVVFEALASDFSVSVYQYEAKIPAYRQWDEARAHRYEKATSLFELFHLLRRSHYVLALDNGLRTFLLNIFLLTCKKPGTQVFLWIGHSKYTIAYSNKLIFKTKLNRVLSKVLYLLADGFLLYSTNSLEYVRDLTEIDKKRCFIGCQQYPALITTSLQRLNRQSSLVRSEISMLFLGSDYKRKGLELLLFALSEASPLEHNIRLHVAGSSVITIDVPQNLTLSLINHGFVDGQNKHNLFLQSDIFVLLSKDEPWGHAYTEALSYGCVPVMTESTGAKDMLRKVLPGHAEALICKLDDPDSIRRSIQYALINLDLLRGLMSTSISEGNLRPYIDPNEFTAGVMTLFEYEVL